MHDLLTSCPLCYVSLVRGALKISHMVKYQTLTDEGGEGVSRTKFERTIMEYQTFFCQGEGVANSYWSDPF